MPGVLSCRQPRVPARRNGHKDAMGTRRHLSNNNDNSGAELLRKEGGAPNTRHFPSPCSLPLSHPPWQTREPSPLHINACHPLSLGSLFLKKCPDCSKIAEVGDLKKKKSGTTKLGVSDDLGFDCVRVERGAGASVISAASICSSSHGGGVHFKGE